MTDKKDRNSSNTKHLKPIEIEVYLAKAYNPDITLDELAERFKICQKTAWNYIQKVKDSDFRDETLQALYRYQDKLIDAVDTILGEPVKCQFFIAKMCEGMGLFNPKMILEAQATLSSEEFKKRLLEERERLLGARTGNRIAGYIKGDKSSLAWTGKPEPEDDV